MHILTEHHVTIATKFVDLSCQRFCDPRIPFECSLLNKTRPPVFCMHSVARTCFIKASTVASHDCEIS